MTFFKTELTKRDSTFDRNFTNNNTNTNSNINSNINTFSNNNSNININTYSNNHYNCKLRLEKIELDNIENRKKYGFGNYKGYNN
jgi:hypothetical protein